MLYRPNPCKNRQAVAAVEFALCAPFLALLVVGMLEISHMANIHQTLQAANREGARFASFGRSINEIGQTIPVTADDARSKVFNALIRSKVIKSVDSIQVQILFLDSNGNATTKQPHEASKGDIFKVITTLPYSKVSLLNFRTFTPEKLVATTTMSSIVADVFTLNTTLPR